MLDSLLPFVPLLFDIGNILCFVGTLPQMYRAWKHRKELRDLSFTTRLIRNIGVLFFLINGLVLSAYIAVILCAVSLVEDSIQMYWIRKAKK